MTHQRFNPHDHLEKLGQQARADAPRPINLAALQRAVFAESRPVSRPTLTEEFSALFFARHIMPTCVASAMAFAVVTSWQLWDAWQIMPWVELIAANNGGMP